MSSALVLVVAALQAFSPTPQEIDAALRQRIVEMFQDQMSGGVAGVYARVRWVVRPSYEEVQAAKPKGVEERGYVNLTCRVAANGLLDECRVAEEYDKGHGFGQAALGLTTKFRLDPAIARHVAAIGANVNLYLAWEGDGGPCQPPNCVGVPPPPRPPSEP